jgi:hypothetical protein
MLRYNFSAGDFIRLRIHGVSRDFLRDLKRLGYNFPRMRLLSCEFTV